MNVGEELGKWSVDPSQKGWLKLREVVKSSPQYLPYDSPIPQAIEALEANEPHRAVELIMSDRVNLLLSPMAHTYLALAYKHLDDPKGREAHGFLAMRCRDAILASGDGSRKKPYLVLRLDDEHDLMKFRGLQPSQRSTEEHRGRKLDVWTMTDGSVLAFDVSDLFARTDSMFGEGPPPSPTGQRGLAAIFAKLVVVAVLLAGFPGLNTLQERERQKIMADLSSAQSSHDQARLTALAERLYHHGVRGRPEDFLKACEILYSQYRAHGDSNQAAKILEQVAALDPSRAHALESPPTPVTPKRPASSKTPKGALHSKPGGKHK